MNKSTTNFGTRSIIGALAFLLLLTVVGVSDGFAKGRKYGLFIGINEYQGDISNLEGAVNDAKNWRSAMINTFGFESSDTRMLLDGQATRQNIINMINSFAIKAEEGDIFVVTYSGHGSLFPDEYSEDIDEKKQTFVDLWFGPDHYVVPRGYYDSTICPVDAAYDTSGKAWGNQILDDELFNMFSAFFEKGANVVFISDSCHSGTISKGEAKNKQAVPRFASPNALFGGKEFGDITFRKPGIQRKVEAVSFNGSYLTMSGSKDSEVSWDAYIDDSAQGLFTSTMLKIIKSRGAGAKNLNYNQLTNLVQAAVVQETRNGYDTVQTPQIDTNFGDPSAKIFQP